MLFTFFYSLLSTCSHGFSQMKSSSCILILTPMYWKSTWLERFPKRCKKVGLSRKVRPEDGWLSCKSRLRKHRVMTMMEYFRLLVCSCESPSRWLLVCGIVIWSLICGFFGVFLTSWLIGWFVSWLLWYILSFAIYLSRTQEWGINVHSKFRMIHEWKYPFNVSPFHSKGAPLRFLTNRQDFF